MKILKVLDEEIVNLIDEDSIDKEIKQCDIYRENLQLALENTEGALRTTSMPSSATVSNSTPLVQIKSPTSPQQSNASTTSQTSTSNEYEPPNLD